MTQVHSRPGFTPRVTQEGKKSKPSRLNDDMQPALAKHTTATTTPSQSPFIKATQPSMIDLQPDVMQAKAEAAFARMQEEKRKLGPEVLLNPNPSATPILTTPHKD